jgi:hypothetical protein
MPHYSVDKIYRVNWWIRVVLEKLTVPHLIKNFPAIYKIQKIKLITRGQNGNFAPSNESSSHFIYLRFTLVLYSDLCDVSKVVFSFHVFWPESVHISHLSLACQKLPHPFHPSSSDHPNIFYKTCLNKILLKLPLDITASVGIQHAAPTESWQE